MGSDASVRRLGGGVAVVSRVYEEGGWVYIAVVSRVHGEGG